MTALRLKKCELALALTVKAGMVTSVLSRPEGGRRQIMGYGQLAAVAALVILAVGPASAETDYLKVGGALLKSFPRGEELCYGLTRSPAYLAENPRLRMTAFHLFKDFDPDPLKEQVDLPRTRQLEEDRASTTPRQLSVRVRFRNLKSVYHQEVECAGTGDNGFGCWRDCDGGGFGVKTSGRSLVIQQQEGMSGLRLQSSCDPDDEGSNMHLDAKLDGAAFQLDPLPQSVCRAERDAARPSWVKSGDPLRVRFEKRANVCHARTYDTAHLKAHPDQKVVAIALRTIGRLKKQSPDDGNLPALEVRLSVKLRDGATRTKTVDCFPGEYTFDCANTQFRLRRAGPSSLMVQDVNYKLAFDEKANHLADFLGIELGDDDRLFQLDERDGTRCEAG
jgi:hypothetical protein